MAEDTTQNTNPQIIIKAINIETDEIICQGEKGEEVIRLANESGENYILDFESDPSYNFLF